MARSYIDYTGDGVTTNRAVPFAYIDESHVFVAVDGVDTAFTWINASTIQISPAPADGAFIKVYRKSSQDERLVDYNVPGTLTEEDLDNDSLQAFFMAQEAIDTAESAMVADIATGQFDAAGRRIVNVGDPEADQDVATKAYGEANWGGAAADQAALEADASAASAAASAASAIESANHATNSENSATASAASAAAAASSASDAADSAAAAALAGMPVGAIFFVPATAAPSGSTKANGAELSRAAYPELWTYAQASGNLVTDAAWAGGSYGSFSEGDGSTTFRVPDLRGYFPRGYDDGSGVDTGRVIGSSQTDENKSHNHAVTDPGHTHLVGYGGAVGGSANACWGPSNGISGWITTYNGNPQGTSISIQNNGSTEARPKNVALLACIKY